MALEWRSSKNVIFLKRNIKHQTTGSMPPFNGQVLAVLFYNIAEVNLGINKSANIAILKYIIF